LPSNCELNTNVFDFDFCQDTTAFKKDRSVIKERFQHLPRYKDHVPDLILASKIRDALDSVVIKEKYFAVGVNFSARNVSKQASREFVDRIIKEIASPFWVYAHVPTAYRPSRFGNGMVGAWLILAKKRST
jgi:hypothetical protein